MTALILREGFDPVRRLPLRRRLRLAGEVLAAYLVTRISLSRNGLPATLERVRRARDVQRLDADDAYSRYAAYRLGQVVEKVLQYLPDARCLTRSIVLVALLARRGVASTLVIGVSPAPDFKAHAWVELEGVPLLPTGESEYSRLAEL